jgi:hypothetical protein
MALEAQRPEVRDVFILARTELSQETAHLSRTGMIVLHRGVYTPDLPRAIANTLAIINGGQLNDFRVFQVVLSPLMVICLGVRIRDALVRHNMYTIPGLNV